MQNTYEARDTRDIEDGFLFGVHIELLGPLRLKRGSPVPIVSPSSRATGLATQNNAESLA